MASSNPSSVIHIKLVDLLKILPGPRIDEKELDAIRSYLLSSGPATRSDLEFEFCLSNSAVLRRLVVLKERGIVEQLPGYRYEAIPC